MGGAGHGEDEEDGGDGGGRGGRIHSILRHQKYLCLSFLSSS